MKYPIFVLLAVVTACKGSQTFVDAGDGADDQVDAGGTVADVAFPAALLLGPGDCGADATSSFDAENTGAGDLDYTITPSTSVFEVSPSSGTIIAGTTTTFTVTAHVPADAAPGTPVTGELSIATSAAAAPVTIAVSAEPRGGVITLAPASAGFGDVPIGDSDQQTITVHNDGNAPVAISFGTPSAAEYGISFTAGALAAGDARDATVTYTPTHVRIDDASAAIAITGATCGAAPGALELSGSGQTAGGVLVTANLAYGTTACGSSATVSRTVTVHNVGPTTATWSASFLADPDTGAYGFTGATSGSLAPDAQATFQVKALPIALPATPGARDVTLRVVTTVAAVPTNHDLSVTQLLSGSFLQVSSASSDFGFAPISEPPLTRSITVTNTGNASATATYTESGAGFIVPQSGATLASGGGSGTFDVSYDPTALGSVTGAVAVSAANACSTTSVSLAGGNGPWTQITGPASVSMQCSNPVVTAGSKVVHNPGTQTLTISGCVETSSTNVDPVVTPSPANVGSGGGSSTLSIGWSAPPALHSGATTATVRCNVNEKFYTTRTFQVVRTLFGADLVLEPVTDLAFSCTTVPDFTEKYVRITNNGNVDAFLSRGYSLPAPLSGVGTGFFTVGSGSDNVSDSEVGVRQGSGACPAGGSGLAGVGTGSANVCSVTPGAHLPVTLAP